jgi:hypothetical protein
MDEHYLKSTSYCRVSLMFGEPKPDLFHRILNKAQDQLPHNECLEDKVLHTYAKTKMKVQDLKKKRKTGTTQWESKLMANAFCYGATTVRCCQRYNQPLESTHNQQVYKAL